MAFLGQGEGDAQRAVAGERADFERSFRADEFDQQAQNWPCSTLICIPALGRAAVASRRRSARPLVNRNGQQVSVQIVGKREGFAGHNGFLDRRNGR
jgi:hypothetical protein